MKGGDGAIGCFKTSQVILMCGRAVLCVGQGPWQGIVPGLEAEVVLEPR